MIKLLSLRIAVFACAAAGAVACADAPVSKPQPLPRPTEQNTFCRVVAVPATNPQSYNVHFVNENSCASIATHLQANISVNAAACFALSGCEAKIAAAAAAAAEQAAAETASDQTPPAEVAE